MVCAIAATPVSKNNPICPEIVICLIPSTNHFRSICDALDDILGLMRAWILIAVFAASGALAQNLPPMAAGLFKRSLQRCAVQTQPPRTLCGGAGDRVDVRLSDAGNPETLGLRWKAAIIAAVDSILSYVQGRQSEIIALIRQFVECESPSDDGAAVQRFNDLVADAVAPYAKVKRVGAQLLCEMDLPGRRKDGQILALGHSDTVWPMGTLRSMPFRQAEGRLWGPGVLDMKSGIGFFLFAVQALREFDRPVSRKVVLQLNSDEEVGSESSRALTEKNALKSTAVLVLEPGTGLTGKIKTARKGVGDFTVTVRGKASHAGVDFQAGASAILELARQIEKVATFTQLKRGITVNPGVISGGTRSNVVAAEASAEVDIRILRLKDAAGLEKKFRGLKPIDKRCTIEITGGLNRPPMERSAGIVQLFRTAQKLGREIGVELEESLTGGGSDGNFTAALGIPTLDGLGAVGEGAHAANESILVDRIADRTALIAHLLTAI
jgi:glutamate carboxypeptidase